MVVLVIRNDGQRGKKIHRNAGPLSACYAFEGLEKVSIPTSFCRSIQQVLIISSFSCLERRRRTYRVSAPESSFSKSTTKPGKLLGKRSWKSLASIIVFMKLAAFFLVIMRVHPAESPAPCCLTMYSIPSRSKYGSLMID